MRSLAIHGATRRWLTKLHRWSGLVIMACMLVAAATGTWLVFRAEMDRWVNPHLRVVHPGPALLSLGAIVERVASGFPNALTHTLILQERPEDSLGVYLEARDGGELEFDQVFVNPYTGEILGQRSTTHIVFAKEYLDPIIDRLHYSLLIGGGWGLWLMGIVAGVWLLTGFVGLALAWPRPWIRMSGWFPVLSARLNRGPYQANYQSHRAVGVWFQPVLILLAFTSFYQNLPQFVTPIVNAVSPLARRPVGAPLTQGATTISPDQAIDSLATRFPAARPSSIGFDRTNSRYSILFRLPGDLSPQGDNWALVDLGTGDMITTLVARDASAGDIFLQWIFPLHTGTAFGLPGRIVIALAGVGLIGLISSGFYVWLVKWRMRRRRNRARNRRRREAWS